MKLILHWMIRAAACVLALPLSAATPTDPNFIASPADLQARIPKQLHATHPDFVVFVPEVTDSGVNDTGNEHFLAFDGPDGSLMAVWTQSSVENFSAAMPADQHIAFARSTDEGVTWSKPRIIAGPKKAGDGYMASWGYPLVSKKGRLYVLYSQHIGKFDSFFHHTGWLHGIYSDDNGATWSPPQNVPVARSVNDNPDPAMPPNMLCWQKPLRLGKDGRYFAGFTRWTSFAVRKPATKSWMSADARVEFMRFENVDDNPEPRDLKIHWSAANEKALAVPFPGHPEASACQEPTVVKLPDGRLFCVMRTASGSPYWSVSADTGETWTPPRRLLRKDGGEPLLHPLSPCPMYDMGGNEAGSGCYALFIHNHDGHYKNYGPADSGSHRRPIYLVAGRFQPGADQPVWFDEPKFFMDHDGTSLGKPGTNGRLDLALYSSFTVRHGQPVLWYPERKFFLLGRKIANAWFAAGAPSAALPVYQPKVTLADIYYYHPAATPALKYNHDVDIVKFKGKFFAGWNANEARGEDKPGQYNFLSVSDDFEHWSKPVRMFTAEAGAKNPVESDNQWQPNFINWKDETLFCSWSDFVARRVFVATSKDGRRWENLEVPNAPAALQGKVCGFPTNHGLLTSKGVMLFPCSLPCTDTPRAIVGHTRYAGVLRSEDGGKTWSWSDPIEAVTWTQAGEKPAEFGGETITLWEPMLFEQADGKIGLLIRNSTAQDNPERAEKPHRMLLYATSADAGKTWTHARPVEVDTICSRNYAISGVSANGSGGLPSAVVDSTGGQRPPLQKDSLLMVMNDNNVRMPERISHDRYFLALYCSPVCEPDLLLPGPVIQPQGGTAFYPNGFVDNGKLYVAYTYPGGIHSSVIEPLPDFTRPFLLPREGRPGLKIEDGIARFGQRQSSLGLALTEKLTRQPKLRLAFDLNVNRYNGGDWPVLTLGGKTRGGTTIRAFYNAETKTDVFQLAAGGNKWTDLASFKMKAWNHFEIVLTAEGVSVSVNQSPAQFLKKPLLRKICFGGLYVAPAWPMGMTPSNDVRLKLDSIVVE